MWLEQNTKQNHNPILQVSWQQSAVLAATLAPPSEASPQPQHIAQAVKAKVQYGAGCPGNCFLPSKTELIERIWTVPSVSHNPPISLEALHQLKKKK